MKIMVEIGHPGHVHHFKNMVCELQNKGHAIQICTTDKEVTIPLLDSYNLQYEILGTNRGKKIFNKILLLLNSEYTMLKVASKFKPDLFISRVSPVSAHISTIFRKPHITFNDTEHPRITDGLALPFTDVVCTSSCFKRDLGKKHIRYNGYTELAYLHPNRFKPNPEVLEELGIGRDDSFIILRFVSWGASHDIGHHGIQNKLEFVKELEKYGRVLITSEADLGPEFEKYKIKVSPEKLHDLLYYATLYIGEGATTASECAILGTHAIYVNTLRLGYTDEEEYVYDLVYNFSDPDTMEKESFNKAIELLKRPNLREEGKAKGEKLLDDKIDVTKFMVEFVENYSKN